MNFDQIDSFFKGQPIEVSQESVSAPSPAPAPAPTVTPPPPGGANPLRPIIVAPAPAAAVPPEPVPPTPAPNAPPATQTAPVPAPAPPAPVLPVPTGDLPNRITTSQFDDKAKLAIDMQHVLNAGLKPGDAGFTPLEDCFTMLAARNGATTAPPTAQPAAPPPPPGPTPVQIAETKVNEARQVVSDLRAELQEASGFGADTSEIQARLNAATDAVTEALADAKVTKVLHERDAADAQATALAQAEARDRQTRLSVEQQVAQEFPGAPDRNTALGAKVQALATAMSNPAHPDHAVLLTPNQARFVTERAANLVAQDMVAMQGVTFEQAYASLRAAPATPTAAGTVENPERRILPAPGGLGTPLPPPARTEQEVMADVGFDPDKLDAALNYGAGRNGWFLGRG